VPHLEISTAVKVQFLIFWLVALCSVMVGYQRFGWLCCFYLQSWGSKLH